MGTFYYYSPIRRGYVVVYEGTVQSTSYGSLSLLLGDWPNAVAA